MNLERCVWPVSRIGEAMEALARRAGLAPRAAAPIGPPAGVELEEWIEAAGQWLGIEAEPAPCNYGRLDELLRVIGPAIVLLPGSRGSPRVLAVAGRWRGRVTLLGPDLAERRIRVEAVRAQMCTDVEAQVAQQVDEMLDAVGVAPRRRDAARSRILLERLGPLRVGRCWMLRPAPRAPFFLHLRQAGVHRRVAAMAVLHLLQYLLWIGSWWMIGVGALEGRLERGWLIAWALLLLTVVPIRQLELWVQGWIAIVAGGLLKRRLLEGALRMRVEETRHQGVGQLLGRVIEAEAVEALALSGGFAALTAAIELAAAAFVLGAGPGGGLHVGLLAVWTAMTLLVAARLVGRRSSWTTHRIDMTHELVERMVGHRTRIAQEERALWHAGEDHALVRHLERSVAMDATHVILGTLIPRGWLLVAFAPLGSAFVSGAAAGELAVGVGGVLLAHRALQGLTAAAGHLGGAWIAWRQVAPMYRAAEAPASIGSPSFALLPAGRAAGTLVEAQELLYRYRDGAEPALRACSLRLGRGERLLLQGPSGGGKSTLVSLLAGLRVPQSGLLLVDGYDLPTLGERGWRRRIAAAPQFHENHVFSETLAFNLFLGGPWPPGAGELEEAQGLCRELGLGPLLDRMPAGMLQRVGETGWQLSHGERSRIYIARALLQGAEAVVLDESFAALDPESLRRAMECVLRRARALVVVAHP